MAKERCRAEAGASLTEAVAGLIVLVPVVLALIDITALVIAQTSNDALAKHAARAAAGQFVQGKTPPVATAQRSQAALAVVMAYGTTAGSLCSSPTMLNYSEPNSGTSIKTQNVKVVTQIVCNLPVPVPFGGPATQTFQASATEPVVGARDVIADPAASYSVGSQGPSDSTYLILSSPLPTGLGGAPINVPAASAPMPQAASTAAPNGGMTTGSTTGVGGDGGGGGGDGGGADGGGADGGGGDGGGGDGGDGG